ncbi:chemotaxis protein CheW [Gluconobacter japonicus]|uniref:chemotaxis protein CheW n=1 Tax=Gluconobacter japonicus TaxID=376620 RepID=UPI0024AD134E|nr:chemotaxis protein CheW [Gluconobacter japonicus]MDI6651418.1 chemotaxis protein CheW [Gluconobacter japonicus]
MEKYLIFTSYDQEYAIDIGVVREIRNWTQSTIIPSSPAYVEGIINIRGTVIPLVDFCKKINPDRAETEKKAMIIIENENKTISFSVKNVSDIIDYNKNDMKTLPEVSQCDISNFVDGIISFDERVIFRLNIAFLIRDCLN